MLVWDTPPAWLPRSFSALSHYNSRTFTSDVIAGMTVGLVALPLSMAFAIASGLPPQPGIYCAIVTYSAAGAPTTRTGSTNNHARAPAPHNTAATRNEKDQPK